MTGGEGARFDLEAVMPITVARTLCQVTPDRKLAGLPLPDDMKVLMQYQLGIIPEILRRATQQDASTTRRCPRAQVKARIKGMFDHSHMLDRLTKDFLESGGDVCGNGTAAA